MNNSENSPATLQETPRPSALFSSHTRPVGTRSTTIQQPSSAFPQRLKVMLVVAGLLAVVALALWLHRSPGAEGTKTITTDATAEVPERTLSLDIASTDGSVASEARRRRRTEFHYSPRVLRDPMVPLITARLSKRGDLVPTAPEASLKSQGLDLTGIVQSPNQRLALIGGRIVRHGDRIGGAAVTKITRTEVFIERQGQTIVLTVDPSGSVGD